MQQELPIPVKRALLRLGRDICDARRRRRITMKIMAQRAGMSRVTLAKIEKGDPTTSFGAYATVLFVLGMIARLEDLADAAHDLTGRQIEDEKLPKRIRMPRSIKNENT